MVNVKEIKKQLEKIKEKKEKISFLEKTLAEAKNKELKEEIKKLLLKFKDDLEEKIVIEEETVPVRISRQDLDEIKIEEETEELIQPATISFEGINLLENLEADRYEPSSKYTGNYGLSTASYTLSSAQVSYEAITTKPFTEFSPAPDKEQIGREQIDPFYQRFFEEGIFTQETSPITEDQRQSMRDKVSGLTTNPEEALRKEQEVLLERKRIDKKYVTRFR